MRAGEADVAMLNAQRSIRATNLVGIAVALLLVGSVAAWGWAVSLTGAVIAPGALVVDSNLRKVQHPTGGVIGEILARDGDRVEAGDVLVRLDETITKANLGIVIKSLDEYFARRARLEAERDEQPGITFPHEIGSRLHLPEVAHIMRGERNLFELRRTARSGQKQQLRERIAQLNQEIQGLTAQATAKTAEIALIQEELKGARELWDRKLYPITKLTSLQREATRLDGERAQLVSSSAQARGKIIETELQLVQVDRDLASDVAKELRDADAKIAELLERKIAAEDQLRRVDIRAPIGGVVYQSTAHTVGGVITSNGEPIMLIVPEKDRLTVEAKVASQDIDQIHLGQQSGLRFVAFNQRTTPEIDGTVSRISADAMTDQRTGASYYVVRISLAEDEVRRLGSVKLVPGMPVEAYMKTGERRAVDYLLKPVYDQMARAFKER